MLHKKDWSAGEPNCVVPNLWLAISDLCGKLSTAPYIDSMLSLITVFAVSYQKYSSAICEEVL